MRILILEDDPLIGLDLQMIVEQCGHEVVGLCYTIAEMRRHVIDAFDFALLDVDLPDGKSYEVAALLAMRSIPFAFVSGSRPSDMPEHLRGARFIPKPYHYAAIRNSLDVSARVAC